jgi:hypothetical protein
MKMVKVLDLPANGFGGKIDSTGSRSQVPYICVMRALKVDTSSVFLTFSATLTPSGDIT